MKKSDEKGVRGQCYSKNHVQDAYDYWPRIIRDPASSAEISDSHEGADDSSSTTKSALNFVQRGCLGKRHVAYLYHMPIMCVGEDNGQDIQ